MRRRYNGQRLEIKDGVEVAVEIHEGMVFVDVDDSTVFSSEHKITRLHDHREQIELSVRLFEYRKQGAVVTFTLRVLAQIAELTDEDFECVATMETGHELEFRAGESVRRVR